MKKVKFFNFIVCLLLVMAGCNDDDNLPSRKNEFDLRKINYQTHLTNPYDTIGKYHNEALAYVFKEYFKSPAAKSSQNEKEKLSKLIVDFMNKKPFAEGVKITEKDIQKMESRVQAKSSNNQLFNSDKQRKYYKNLKDKVRKDKHSSPQDLISSINKLEKQVAESDLPESEQAQLLIGMSVAKYSSVFWMEQIKNMESQAKTTNAIPEEEMYDGDWNRWFESFLSKAEEIFWADVEGGIGGFATSFIFIDYKGLLIPGMGLATIQAAMGYVVSFAIGASAWQGIKILWNIVFE